jgi:hypothetical protein
VKQGCFQLHGTSWGAKIHIFYKDSMVVVLQGYGHALSIVKNIVKGIKERLLMTRNSGLCTSSQK